MHSHATVERAAWFLAVGQLEHAGTTRLMATGSTAEWVCRVAVQSGCAEWVCRVLANQQAELFCGVPPHPCFFSAKNSLNRSDSIATRASDITRW